MTHAAGHFTVSRINDHGDSDQNSQVSRVAATLRVDSEADFGACVAQIGRVIDRGDAATEQEIDLITRLAVGVEEYERRDTRSVGGQAAMPVGGPRSDADRELLRQVIARAPHVTDEQARRLWALASGHAPDDGGAR